MSSFEDCVVMTFSAIIVSFLVLFTFVYLIVVSALTILVSPFVVIVKLFSEKIK